MVMCPGRTGLCNVRAALDMISMEVGPQALENENG